MHPLHQLSDGTWIDPLTVTALVPSRPKPREGDVPNRQPTVLVACGPDVGIKLWFDDVATADAYRDELSVVINDARRGA